jgi:hypothetical protein
MTAWSIDTVREAAPVPSRTFDSARSFGSFVRRRVLPAITACIIRSTSCRVTALTGRVPSMGAMWAVIRLRSVAIVAGRLGRLRRVRIGS